MKGKEERMTTQRMTIPIKGMTCAGCVAHIEAALRQEDGVVWASVNFAAEEANIIYDPAIFQTARAVRVVRRLGYDVPTKEGQPAMSRPAILHVKSQALSVSLPLAAGLAGMAFLMSLYLGLVTLAQGWQHAVELMWGDRWLVGAIAGGFGVQVGLYVYLRRLRRRHHALRSPTALTAAGTGTSSVAMVACCAHHVTDALPMLGLSAAATFLSQYRIPFMLLGIVTNLVGIAIMLRLILKERAQQSDRCHTVGDKAQAGSPEPVGV